MKKKFVLMIAIVLVAATACALLVGCAPKTPVDFMDKWLDSNNKAMVMGDTEISIYGNVAMAKTKKGDLESVSYTEITDDSINMYSSRVVDGKTTWSAFSMTKAEFKEMYKLETDDVTMNDVLKSSIEFDKDDYKDFEKNFTKENGVYVGNAGTEFEGVSITIAAKEMTISMTMGETKVEATYKIGCDKIEISQEAKDALVKE